MKIRRSIILFCVIVAALTALVIWFAKRPILTAVPAAALHQPTQAVVTVSAQPATSLSTHSVANVTVPISTNASRESKGQKMAEILSTENDIPIIFYGRLVDQFGNSVAGAQIEASVRVFNGVRSTVDRFSLASDANGLFQINHGKGESLGVMPKKTGYTLATTDTEFRYSHLDPHPYIPDAGNPTIIKMWKLQGAEPLMGIDLHYKLHYTSEQIDFDLLTGKVGSDGGDVKLRVNRASGIISGRNQPDWGVEVEAVGGGIMDSAGLDTVTYAAPESGYQSNITLDFSTNSITKWADGFSQGFFVMSRNGQVYSKLGISFRINDDPDGFMYITFKGIANTNGSRNWEPPARQ